MLRKRTRGMVSVSWRRLTLDFTVPLIRPIPCVCSLITSSTRCYSEWPNSSTNHSVSGIAKITLLKLRRRWKKSRRIHTSALFLSPASSCLKNFEWHMQTNKNYGIARRKGNWGWNENNAFSTRFMVLSHLFFKSFVILGQMTETKMYGVIMGGGGATRTQPFLLSQGSKTFHENWHWLNLARDRVLFLVGVYLWHFTF